MDRTELGRLIKEARLSKKMTQSEVVGDFITRNMLSQIESGSAVPSIKTLEYLSKKLDISIKMLTPEAQHREEGEIKEAFVPVINAKEAYNSARYKTAIDLIRPLLTAVDSPVYDEACTIYAKSCLAYSKTSNIALGDALTYAKEALLYAEKGFYANKEYKTAAFEQLTALSRQ